MTAAPGGRASSAPRDVRRVRADELARRARQLGCWSDELEGRLAAIVLGVRSAPGGFDDPGAQDRVLQELLDEIESPKETRPRYVADQRTIEPAPGAGPVVLQVGPSDFEDEEGLTGDVGTTGTARPGGAAGHRVAPALQSDCSARDLPEAYDLVTWISVAISRADARTAGLPADRYAGIPLALQRLFHLCWYLKGHPELQEVEPEAALDRLTSFRPDWRQALGLLWSPDEPTSAMYRSDAEVDAAFVARWVEVRTPYSLGIVPNALRRAHEEPLPVRRVIPAANELVVALASALGYIQVADPAASIIVPRELWGESMGVSARTVTDLVRRLLAAGILREVDGGHWEPRRKAAQYRFNIVVFPELAAHVPADIAEVVHGAFRALPQWSPRDREGRTSRGQPKLARATVENWKRRQSAAPDRPPPRRIDR